MARILVLLIASLQLISGLQKNDLYPFGVDNQDRRLPAGDDVSSEEIFLSSQIPIAFYDDYFNSVYVSIIIC